MQTLTSGAEGGLEVGEEQEVVEEDTQGTLTTSTWGAKENMIDTTERKPFFVRVAVQFKKLMLSLVLTV